MALSTPNALVANDYQVGDVALNVATSVTVGQTYLVGFSVRASSGETGGFATVTDFPADFTPVQWIKTPPTVLSLPPTYTAGPIVSAENATITYGTPYFDSVNYAYAVIYRGSFSSAGTKTFTITFDSDQSAPLPVTLAVNVGGSVASTGNPRKVTVDLLSKTGTVIQSDLTITGGYWSDDDSDAGAAEVTVPNIGYAPALNAIEDTLIRFKVDGVTDRTALVEKVNVVVRSTNPAEQLRVLQGRDWVCEFADAVVDPPLGVSAYPAASTVTFDWKHPDLDRTGWITPTFVGGVYKADISPLGTPLPPFAGKIGQAPQGWPDVFSAWMWSAAIGSGGAPANSHRTGISYFYLPVLFKNAYNPAIANGFTGDRGVACKADVPFVMTFTADDYGQLAFDGAIVDSGAEWPAVQWQRTTASGIPSVSAGTHYIAIKVTNVPFPDYNGNYNVGSYAFSAFQPLVNQSFDWVDNIVIRTGNQPTGVNLLTGGNWKCFQTIFTNQGDRESTTTPAAPGFTVGRAFRILFQKTQASGHLQGWTLGFTDANDSNGNPWPVTDELTARVNDPLLEVMKSWHDQGQWDFAARAGTRVLDGWRWQERGDFYSGGALTWDDDNLSRLAIEGSR
jgi:hypothetical protein